jgi:hypothetical protein
MMDLPLTMLAMCPPSWYLRMVDERWRDAFHQLAADAEPLPVTVLWQIKAASIGGPIIIPTPSVIGAFVPPQRATNKPTAGWRGGHRPACTAGEDALRRFRDVEGRTGALHVLTEVMEQVI